VKDNPSELERQAVGALESFQERFPYLVWIETSATKTVGKSPPADIDDYHKALDAWAEEIDNLRVLSMNLRDAQLRLAEAISGRVRGPAARRKIIDDFGKRDVQLRGSSDRIQNLRKIRPR
jgi:hypothetical protein